MQLIFVAVLIIGLAFCVPMNCEESDYQLWDTFKIEHLKKYTTPEEESRRKAIFLENLQYIRENNKRFEDGQVSYELATNQFSDLTNEEFYDTRLMKPSLSNLSTPTEFFSSSAVFHVPDKFDWTKRGAVTSVKNQGQCKSCWAFSTVGSLEGLHFIKTGQLLSLSAQNLVDCNKRNDGCEGGWPFEAFNYIKRNGGIDTDKSYPYIESNGSCKYNPKNVGASDKGFVRIPIGDEQKLKEAVATIGPISIVIDASSPPFQNYHKGVLMEPDCKSDIPSLNHCVVAVGYGTTDSGYDYWLIKNSWGEDWGMNGYGMMARNEGNQCGVATFATYPVL